MDEVRDGPAIARHEDEQMRVEPVPHAGRFPDEILLGLEEESQLARAIGEPDRWQVRLTGGHPGDRECVTRIALAWSTRSATRLPSSSIAHP